MMTAQLLPDEGHEYYAAYLLALHALTHDEDGTRVIPDWAIDPGDVTAMMEEMGR